MFIPLLHFALCILLAGTLIRLIEYHYPESLLGKLLIFAY